MPLAEPPARPRDAGGHRPHPHLRERPDYEVNPEHVHEQLHVVRNQRAKPRLPEDRKPVNPFIPPGGLKQ